MSLAEDIELNNLAQAPENTIQTSQTVVRKRNMHEEIGENANAGWYIHALVRLGVITMLALLVFDFPVKEIAKDLGFFYVNWTPNNPSPGSLSSDCDVKYDWNYHQNAITQCPSSDDVKMCLDKNIWVGTHQVVFELETTDDGDKYESLNYDMVSNSGKNNACTLVHDQCCEAFRAMYGTNIAVLITFSLTTIFMVIRHPWVPSISQTQTNRQGLAPGNWLTIVIKGLQFLIYLIIFLYFMSEVLKGPRCNQNFDENENDQFSNFGNDVDDNLEYGVNFAMSIALIVLFFLDFLGEVAARAVYDVELKDLSKRSALYRYATRFGLGFGQINKEIGESVSSVYNLQKKRNRNETKTETQSLYW